MTLKYESELLFDLMKRDGDDAPSDVLPYESELKEKYLNQVTGAYPKLQDYQPEWLNYNLYHHLPSDFPVESVSNVTSASFNNVVPYAYGSAILKGNTKYRDIDTGEILESFETGRSLELVSVKMPVLTTIGKNLIASPLIPNTAITWGGGNEFSSAASQDYTSTDFIKIQTGVYYISSNNKSLSHRIHCYDTNKMYLGALKTDGSIAKDSDNPVVGKKFKIVIENVRYVRLTFYGNIETAQLEQGSIATSYEPFKSNILTVNEDVELRGIGDVKDELNLMTGELTQRIKEVTLNGTENWVSTKDWMQDGETYAAFLVDKSSNGKVISNKFNTNLDGSITNTDVERLSFPANGWIGIRILKSKLSSINVTGFKQWLSENPVTIQYGLATESVKTVDLTCINEQGESETFRPIEGTMHVNTSSQTLPPLLDMSVPVEATTQNLMSFANIEVEE